MSRFMDRVRYVLHSWNAFREQEDNYQAVAASSDLGSGYSYRPDRQRLRYISEKTIISAIYTRLAIDIAAIPIRHVRLDENRQYQEDINSGLNDCLLVEANIDQGGTQFRQDIAQSLFDWGVVALVPVDTTLNPLVTGSYDITSLRVAQVMQWYPRYVQVRVYNDNPKKGIKQDLLLPKSMVAIVENPLYMVMNEPNSTLQRLLRTLRHLDAVDEQSASGKLDLIIQLPYVIKTETRRAEAEKRRKEVEFQLKGSQYGVAYADGTEKIIQLNRPVENNLMERVKFLTEMLYGQLGLTEEVMNGTADEATMINYYNRSVKPVLTAVTEAMIRTFLTKTARSQGQALIFVRNPFDLVPVKELAEIVDKFTRNEVASSNDMRSVIGWRPSKDPKADKLLNKNIPAAAAELPSEAGGAKPPPLKALPGQSFPPVTVPPRTQGVNSQNGR